MTKRSWLYFVSVALLLTLLFADASYAKKKSRPSRGASRSHVKGKSARTRRGREIARKDSRGKKGVRGKYASRRRRGRHVARRRGGSFQPQEQIASGAPRPAPGISTERVTEIQTALIKGGYLDGPPSGQYDDATVEAMKQYQANNGLPQTGLPSATLLKKLGVSKRSNDGYAVPVNSVSENDKKRPPQ